MRHQSWADDIDVDDDDDAIIIIKAKHFLYWKTHD